MDNFCVWIIMVLSGLTLIAEPRPSSPVPPIVCPEGKEYQVCGTACPSTCLHPARTLPCWGRCVDTCFCKSGTVLLNGTSDKCVPIYECPSKNNNVANSDKKPKELKYDPDFKWDNYFPTSTIETPSTEDDVYDTWKVHPTRRPYDPRNYVHGVGVGEWLEFPLSRADTNKEKQATSAGAGPIKIMRIMEPIFALILGTALLLF